MGGGVFVGGTGVGVGSTGVNVGLFLHPDQQKDQVGLRHSTSSPKSGSPPLLRLTDTFQSKQPLSERASAQR